MKFLKWRLSFSKYSVDREENIKGILEWQSENLYYLRIGTNICRLTWCCVDKLLKRKFSPWLFNNFREKFAYWGKCEELELVDWKWKKFINARFIKSGYPFKSYNTPTFVAHSKVQWNFVHLIHFCISLTFR